LTEHLRPIAANSSKNLLRTAHAVFAEFNDHQPAAKRTLNLGSGGLVQRNLL
jgi:hypothetical protein